MPHLERRLAALEAKRASLDELAFETERGDATTLAEVGAELDRIEGRNCRARAGRGAGRTRTAAHRAAVRRAHLRRPLAARKRRVDLPHRPARRSLVSCARYPRLARRTATPARRRTRHRRSRLRRRLRRAAQPRAQCAARGDRLHRTQVRAQAARRGARDGLVHQRPLAHRTPGRRGLKSARGNEVGHFGPDVEQRRHHVAERADDLRLEAESRFFLDLFDRDADRCRFAPRATRGQRRERVGDGDDAREERDRVVRPISRDSRYRRSARGASARSPPTHAASAS